MKGQIWSADFIVSVVIFFSALAIVTFAWNHAASQSLEQRTLADMQTATIRVADSLIRTPGYPENWNASDVEQIGLATTPYIINQTKLEQFLALDYSDAKRLLGLRGDWEFYFEMSYLNGTVVETKGTYSQNTLTASPITRNILYGKMVIKLIFMTWE